MVIVGFTNTTAVVTTVTSYVLPANTFVVINISTLLSTTTYLVLTITFLFITTSLSTAVSTITSLPHLYLLINLLQLL